MRMRFHSQQAAAETVVANKLPQSALQRIKKYLREAAEKYTGEPFSIFKYEYLSVVVESNDLTLWRAAIALWRLGAAIESAKINL